MSLENEQVTLQLTRDKETLAMIRRRKQFQKEADPSTGKQTGREYLAFAYNSAEIRFHPGVKITVDSSIASALLRQASIIPPDDDLTGEPHSMLDVVERFQIGAENRPANKLTCNFCAVTKETPQELFKHILSEHPEMQSHGDDEENEPAGDGLVESPATA